MNDFRGSKFCNRGIIVFSDAKYVCLTVAIIDNVNENTLSLIVVHPEGTEKHELKNPTLQAMNLKHSQIPGKIREQVLKLTKFRIR